MKLLLKLGYHYLIGMGITALFIGLIVLSDYLINGILQYPELGNFSTVSLLGGVFFGITHMTITTAMKRSKQQRQYNTSAFNTIVEGGKKNPPELKDIEVHIEEGEILSDVPTIINSGTPVVSDNITMPPLPQMQSQPSITPKKKHTPVGRKKLNLIRDHFINNKELNTSDCYPLFKVKSLRHFITELRKEGFKIKAYPVFDNPDKRDKYQSVTYKLLSSSGNSSPNNA